MVDLAKIMGLDIAVGAVGAVIANGTYTGDDSVNRAIPHGLGIVPRLVFIYDSNAIWFILMAGLAGRVMYSTAAAKGWLSHTAKDATDFYVGNATSYVNSANTSASVYYWVAIG